MTSDEIRKADEAEVRSVIDAVAGAVRAGDVDALLAQCAPNLATFDLVPPLKHEGPTAIRRLWSKTLAGFQPPLEYDIHDLDLVIGADVAFSRSLNRLGGQRADGTRTSSWLCTTLGFCKMGGRWRIMHEHTSVPFDMGTGKALLDLRP